MAESPSHRFGQIVGNLLEELLLPVLVEFCSERSLYLDRHGARVGVRAGQKVSWDDKYGNSHDLDFVVEKDGTPKQIGRPVAFIEAAWRRHTKHSRNKAQEIQGALLPIAERFAHDHPFLGVVLAGVFTAGSLNQLRSVGFHVAYLPYETIVASFASIGIDVRFDEDTPDTEFDKCVRLIEALPKDKNEALKANLLKANEAVFKDFFGALERKLDRIVERIVVVPLFGTAVTFSGATSATEFLDEFEIATPTGDLRKFEVTVVYSNGDQVQGMFATKTAAKGVSAIRFGVTSNCSTADISSCGKLRLNPATS